jgi:rod shape-determining protein MreC
LKNEIKRLQQENLSLREMALANIRLRKLLGFRKSSSLNLVAAEVVGVDSSLYFKSIIIDKGVKHGIKKDLAVISPDGVVGRILKTMDSFSVVLLLFDQNFALDAMVQRTRSRGIVEGAGKNLCKMKYVLGSEDIRNGDVVLTSGMEGVFPKGIMIGKIVSVKRGEGSLFQNIIIRPNFDFRKLEEVFVVLNQKE